MRRERQLVIAAVVATVIFTVLAILMPRGVLLRFDTAIMLAIRELHGPLRDRVMTAITDLGWAPVVIGVVIIFALWSWLDRDRRAALVLVTIAVANLAVNAGLKQGFQRPRPELWPRIPLDSFAFPSGHSMTGVAIYGLLAIVLVRRAPASRRWVLVLGPLVSLSIGLSRIYLGVHWPTDVLAGWAVGLVLLVIGALGMGWRR